MVISNLEHKRKCNPRCKSFDGYKTHCVWREPNHESMSSYKFRLARMRGDTEHHRVTHKLNGEVVHETIKDYHPIENYGKCTRDTIETDQREVKARRRVGGGVM